MGVENLSTSVFVQLCVRETFVFHASPSLCHCNVYSTRGAVSFPKDSCEVDWQMNIYWREWTVHMFALMVPYFAPRFLTREESFHNESSSYLVIAN